MTSSNKVKLKVEWRRLNGDNFIVWNAKDGKEGRPIYMLYLLLEYYKKRGFLTRENSHKLLQYLTCDEINLVSPGQLIFYGGFLDPKFLEKEQFVEKNGSDASE